MIDRLAQAIVAIVIGVWLVTTLVLPFVVKDYSPPASVGVTMGSLASGAVAYLFARRADAKRKGNGRRDKPRATRKPPEDEE